jgi:phosphatidylglycerophosphate synthase
MSNGHQSPGHRRENNSVLAALEKRALIWIASNLPDRVTSDHLSALGLASMVAAGVCFAAARWNPMMALAVVPCLVLNWFGDSLDGTVARVRNQQRPRYGFYVDHVIDIAGTGSLLLGLGVSNLMYPELAFGLLAAYLAVSAEVYLATHVTGVFCMSWCGFGPTELRIVLAAGVIKAAFNPWVTIGTANVRLFDLGGAVATVGLVLAFIVAALRNTRALYRDEPLPGKSGRKPGSAEGTNRDARFLQATS